ncbi:MAG: hypothetical protein IPP33_17925 [Flavobacteriales bacterium]|nr:hypothetical protein [Flavobacteriales bacterium]
MSVTLVADIGGTSSRWGIIRSGHDPRIIEGLPGFNPSVGDPRLFASALKAEFQEQAARVTAVFAYGAGCGTRERAEQMAHVLLAVWPRARIDVASDLMGAAHGLLGTNAGFVLILGTGMNAAWYNGSILDQPMPSLGYILGDEGSGADIGKYALIDALHGRMPVEVRDHVFPAGLAMPEVVKELYRGSSPQAWLASFTAPIAGLTQHAYVQGLVRSRFNALADRLCAYFPLEQRSSITATGSVAFGLADTLRTVLAERGLQLIDVQRSPMPGLLKYRSEALL